MSHTLIADLYPDVRIAAPGVLEPVMRDAVRDAIQEFFLETEVWKHLVPGLLDWTAALSFPALVAGTEIPTGTELVRVDTVKFANDGVSLRKVVFKTMDQLDDIYSDWEIKTATCPVYWTNNGGDAPMLVPAADADVLTSLKLRVVICPDETIAAMDDKFYHRYREAFIAGALASLLKIPGKDWTNASLAAHHLNVFSVAKVKAKSRAGSDGGRPSRETSYGGI
jgi:hypothetical protein